MRIVELARPLSSAPDNPFLERIRRLGDLTADALAQFERAIYPPRRIGARGVLLAELRFPSVQRALISGWAGRVRILSDGRRQLIELFLPGDMIEITSSTATANPDDAVVALTEVTSCAIDPAIWDDPALRDLRRKLDRFATALLRNQVMRLGRQSAYERLGHLLLELRERQAVAGMDAGTVVAMPLTQEMLGETLGLTTVHLNRTLQQLRREAMVRTSRAGIELPDPETLARITDYIPMNA
ncbi:Crp/Fnr family transcriptional regulator [Sphingomonas sp.]|uniref:Crp/Fnr family transcriptional regulator n=1 Tax=Sphingomonas sp. TaxID=28214 RepID=UPI002D1C683E|nr:Crp/Fnr family transcriptional regulator [Sphingomonas sp.]HTG38936.1 Crp/Fnr family transcriptional regulator [Sphingomonas sp.]